MSAGGEALERCAEGLSGATVPPQIRHVSVQLLGRLDASAESSAASIAVWNLALLCNQQSRASARHDLCKCHGDGRPEAHAYLQRNV